MNHLKKAIKELEQRRKSTVNALYHLRILEKLEKTSLGDKPSRKPMAVRKKQARKVKP